MHNIIIDAQFIEEGGKLPPPPKVPHFSIISVSPKKENTSFVLACFIAPIIGGMVGLVISLLIKSI